MSSAVRKLIRPYGKLYCLDEYARRGVVQAEGKKSKRVVSMMVLKPRVFLIECASMVMEGVSGGEIQR